MLSAHAELRLHRFLNRLYAQLRRSRDPEQAVRSALRATAGFLGLERACIAELHPGEDVPRVLFDLDGGGETWNLDLLRAFLRHEHPGVPEGILLAPLRRRGRLWRVLAFAGQAETDEVEARSALARIARAVSEVVRQIDRERSTDVRTRIDRKIMEELRPKDLFYQILHGLRSLTGYDHSSALLMAEASGGELELVAEQIAWRKSKSSRIGMRLEAGLDLAGLLRTGEVYGFDRQGDKWSEWTARGAGALVQLLDYNRGADDAREASLLCAPLRTRDGPTGLLKVAARHAGGLGPWEADLVRRFLPQVAVALQNSRRAQSLETQMLQAEKKHAMANLARSVAHDVNNALGSVLPLVQQMREDLGQGRVEPAVLAEDLESIERSLGVCRRIFGGMLAFARGAARSPGEGDVRRAVDSALAILQDGMERRRVQPTIELQEGLPAIRGGQTDLEQVFFNLLANARDSMPRGGQLTVRAERQEAHVDVSIEDSGHGISERDLPMVFEPFFTTKTDGNGLGLTICRSILWEIGGEMNIDSAAGRGTRVRLRLPVAAAGRA